MTSPETAPSAEDTETSFDDVAASSFPDMIDTLSANTIATFSADDCEVLSHETKISSADLLQLFLPMISKFQLLNIR